MEKNLTIWRKIKKQTKEFNVKESQCYNFSVLINHYQDLEKRLSSVVRSQTCNIILSKTYWWLVNEDKL